MQDVGLAFAADLHSEVRSAVLNGGDSPQTAAQKVEAMSIVCTRISISYKNERSSDRRCFLEHRNYLVIRLKLIKKALL